MNCYECNRKESALSARERELEAKCEILDAWRAPLRPVENATRASVDVEAEQRNGYAAAVVEDVTPSNSPPSPLEPKWLEPKWLFAR